MSFIGTQAAQKCNNNERHQNDILYNLLNTFTVYNVLGNLLNIDGMGL